MGTTQKNIIRDKHAKAGQKPTKQKEVAGGKIPPQVEKNNRIKELIEKAKKK